MLNQELFFSEVKKLQRNFEFVESKEYYFDIFTALEDKINDKMFIDGCNNILKKTTKEEWSKAYGYKGRPAIGDWLNIFIAEITKNSMQNNEITLKDEEFLELIDIEVKKFLSIMKWHFLIERAKQDNCFGSFHSKKDLFGLLGYLRMNFATQIRILNNYNNHFPISNNHCKFLGGNWFKEQVLENNCISYNLHFPEFETYKFI
ncbi:MAG: hypothetical protein LW595_06645 [Rickettsiales bacterium]|nr:hypothetical protein [Rickettsiales bacterium]